MENETETEGMQLNTVLGKRGFLTHDEREPGHSNKPHQKKESKEWWYVQCGERCRKDSVGVAC